MLEAGTKGKRMTLSVREVSAIGAGGSVLAGSLLGLPFHFFGDLALGVPLAIVTAAGIFKFWPSAHQVQREQELDTVIAAVSKQAGIDTKEVLEAINTSKAKLEKIRQHAADIRAPNTKRRIEHICKIGDQIVEDFRVDPKDVRVARSWSGTYLDQTIDLVKAYAQLSRTGARNIEAQNQMAKFDSMLDLIESKFDELLKSLLENDVMDFDVNASVMRNMLEQEGIRS
jgi:5-bromo-4-chloroindolyl phosphate hydrolysis protein